jgi:hypothetical protein
LFKDSFLNEKSPTAALYFKQFKNEKVLLFAGTNKLKILSGGQT